MTGVRVLLTAEQMDLISAVIMLRPIVAVIPSVICTLVGLGSCSPLCVPA